LIVTTRYYRMARGRGRMAKKDACCSDGAGRSAAAAGHQVR